MKPIWLTREEAQQVFNRPLRRKVLVLAIQQALYGSK